MNFLTAKGDILGGILLAILTAGYLYSAQGLPASTTPGTPGPSLYPQFIGVCALLLSATLFVQGIVRLRTQQGKAEQKKGLGRSFLTLAAIAVYILALPFIGLLVASILLFATLMTLYRATNPIHVVIASLLVPLALFIIIRHGFQIVLPTGILGF